MCKSALLRTRMPATGFCCRKRVETALPFQTDGIGVSVHAAVEAWRKLSRSLDEPVGRRSGEPASRWKDLAGEAIVAAAQRHWLE